MSKFSLQLQKIMDHFSLSTTELSDTILVPRATISHLMSERNKPSLEFITKLHTRFPTLNLEWLIYGKEPFLITDKEAHTIDKSIEKEPVFTPNISIEEREIDVSIEKNIEQKGIENEEKILSFPKKDVEAVVILYTDGTFKHYHP